MNIHLSFQIIVFFLNSSKIQYIFFSSSYYYYRICFVVSPPPPPQQGMNLIDFPSIISSDTYWFGRRRRREEPHHFISSSVAIMSKYKAKKSPMTKKYRDYSSDEGEDDNDHRMEDVNLIGNISDLKFYTLGLKTLFVLIWRQQKNLLGEAVMLPLT